MSKGNSARILIVEDDAKTRRLVAAQLTIAGYQIVEAEGGAAALTKATRSIDAILLDLMLPDMSGLELIEKLKAGAETQNIPVLGFTALVGEEVKQKMLEAGADDFVHKPASRSELSARLNNLIKLRRSQTQLAQKNLRLEELLAERTHQLKRADYLFSETLDALPSLVAIIDFNGTITAVNEAWREFCRDNGGDTNTYYVGRPYLQLEAEEDRDQWESRFRDLLKWKAESFTEKYRCDSQSEARWFQVTFSAVQVSSAAYVVAVHSDISEIVASQESLLKSESMFRSLVVTAPALIAVIQKGGDVVLTNAGVKHRGGELRCEAPYNNAFDYIEIEDRALIENAMEEAERSGEIQSYELKAIMRGSQKTWAETHLRHLEGTGENALFLFHTSDISSRKDAEKRLAESQEQLLQSQKLEAIGALAGGVAHDFNNLLTVILSCCDQIHVRSGADSELQKLADEIHSASNRAADLTGRLLSFARREPREISVFDINKMLRNIQPLICRTIGENIEFQLQLASDEALVEACSSQIDQVLLNLVVNARDAMPDGGHLRVTCEIVESEAEGQDILRPYVEISVEDSGRGMEPGVQARIFEPFFTTKARGQGTGLGLSTGYGIVASAGGNLLVESAVGQGTTFKVQLPLTTLPKSVVLDDELKQTTLEGSEVVLIVEDDRAIRRVLQAAFEGAGYDVILARSGEEALDEFRENSGEIELLVSDILLPGISGFEVASAILEAVPTLPVLLSTGYAGDVAKLRNTLPPDIPIVRKPFRGEEMLWTARYLLDGPRRQSQKRARSAPLPAADSEMKRVLVVDDDPSLQRVFTRMLAGKFAVTVVGSVAEALEQVDRSEAFDALLCDLNLGEGGSGMDLYAELLNVAPGLAERTVFLTGGATEGASAAFVAKHSERVILKPPTPGLIVAQLKALFED